MSYLKLIAEEVIECVNCGKKRFKVRFYLYPVPYFEDIVLQVGVCDYCGYRRADVSILNPREPTRIIVKVRNVKDLNALVIKSSTATIKIPELGIEIYPGPTAPGYITTIEGILHRVLDHIPADCFIKESKCYYKVEEVREAINGKKGFTLIIEDPLGRSEVLGQGLDIRKERLSEKEFIQF